MIKPNNCTRSLSRTTSLSLASNPPTRMEQLLHERRLLKKSIERQKCTNNQLQSQTTQLKLKHLNKITTINI